MTAARDIIDANAYMTLVSRPEARHSRNLAVRPQLAIVIFDSTVPEGQGQAVYIEAEAEQVDDGIEVFSRRSQARGAGPWTISDVTAPAALRLYRAIASAHFLLGDDDRRVRVRLDS